MTDSEFSSFILPNFQNHPAAMQRFLESSNLSPEELYRRNCRTRVATVNAIVAPDDGTGIECSVCNNRSFYALSREGDTRQFMKPCKCIGPRNTRRRLKELGLEASALKCTLASFQTNTPLQKAMHRAATDYLANPDRHWLAFLGQSGCGKTHLCTAVFMELVDRHGYTGDYFRWVDDIRTVKASAMDEEDPLKRYKDADLLYIDDLFKGSTTPADVKYAFELINYRYNQNRPTIISSEYLIDELSAIDEAVAGRIVEMCGESGCCTIGKDVSKNYRYRRVG